MKTYNKLIRDRIPEIIEKEGIKFKTRILSEDEFKIELLKKLVEEANEVIASKDNTQELQKEMGDVLELIEYIIKKFNLNEIEIKKLKSERKISRGGFDKRLFLEWTE